MKENIDICYVYNLVDENGTKLQLRLGRLKGYSDELLAYHCDQGFRWSFVGSKIPMPVRAYTWFNGFPENIMLDWLKGNGWALRSRVEMGTGKATVYELPFVDKPSKGNEKPTEEYKLTDEAIRRGEAVLKEAIRLLCNNGSALSAIALYRLAHPCTLVEAKHVVDDIRFDNAT